VLRQDSESGLSPVDQVVLVITDPVGVDDVLDVISEDRSEQVGVFHHRRDKMHSAVVSEGAVSSWDHGPRSCGEEGERVTAETLRVAITRDGVACGPPVFATRDARSQLGWDWKYRLADGSDFLLQRVRVPIEGNHWLSFKAQGQSTLECSLDSAALKIRMGIEKKVSRYSSQDRLVLALDATRAGALALPRVTSRFRRDHGEWASSLGFRAIWIVGVNVSTTVQLA